ncbi:MAG: translation initiation factor IF-2 [Planctomycetaceae bacterium]|nr:translation initiation factor IF-2 [Planctomycetaceae bacterium]
MVESTIRIYALAKQLNIETKVLFELCKKADIEGKSNTLASLTEAEVARVKEFIKSSAAPKTSAPTLVQRPVLGPTGGKVPVLKTQQPVSKPVAKDDLQSSRGSQSVAKTTADSPSEILSEPTSAPVQAVIPKPSPATDTKQPVNIKPATPPVQKPLTFIKSTQSERPLSTKDNRSEVRDAHQKKQKQNQERGQHQASSDNRSQQQSNPQQRRSPLGSFLKKESEGDNPRPQTGPIHTGLSTPGHAAAVRHEDYRGPMRNLQEKRKPSEGGAGERSNTTQQQRPVSGLKLAPIPTQRDNKRSKSKEPTPQKPDMRLPSSLIAAAKQGLGTTIEAHIRTVEQSQSQESAKRVGDKGVKRPKSETVSVAPDENSRKRRKKRRGSGTVDPIEAFEATQTKKKPGVPGRRGRSGEELDDMPMLPRRLVRKPKIRGVATSTAAPRKSDIVIQVPCTVKNFAVETGLPVSVVIKKLLELKMLMTINSQLDFESASLLAESFDIRISVRDEITLEDDAVVSLFAEDDPPESLQSRPPVVTFLGHVDHGKTSLLDHILKIDVVSGEKGGITQHIRAYRITAPDGRDITFVDTPGHEAFTEMRARGANVTDIAVLVVAADDGVMPQTEEAISHAKAAGVPIVVALNKMDLPGANPDRAIQGLAQNELIPSDWGGDTEIVRCSALTGDGVDTLLDTLLMIADLHELKANPDRPAIGTALESSMRSGEGVVCKMLVQSGTIRTGDIVLCGTAYGRVKAMFDTLDPKKVIEEATPGTPVNLIGLDVAPNAGSRFCVLDDISVARRIATERQNVERRTDLEQRPSVTLENILQRINANQTVSTLNIIIRADVRGSIEAIKKELEKLDHSEVKIKILQAMVGGITEADVQLADASEAIIVGFNVVPDESARALADAKKVQIRRYDIIYNLASDIKAALEGMLKPEEKVKELGRALVQRVYSISRLGNIAGCRVMSGSIERDARVRVIRENRVIGEYPLESLKREKDDVREVREGYECGMKLRGFNDMKEGDVLEAYKVEEIARTFG